MHETEIIAGENVTRFYEILKYRHHRPDTNKYKILDNSAFSLYSCINNGEHLEYFAGKKQETTPARTPKNTDNKTKKDGEKPFTMQDLQAF